nr:hypothetical protein [Tanacetum cinerariifolium]
MFSPSTVTYTSVYIISKPWRLRMKRTRKEDPADYLVDRGNNDDDESSNDDDDDDDVEKDEEEEHLASADPSDVYTDDLVPLS